jgi:hypothetical protein
MQVDFNKLLTAALIVIIFGLFILSLTYIIPILAGIIALGLVILLVYVVYLFLTGKIQIKR